MSKNQNTMKTIELMNLARLRIRGGYDFLSDFLFSLDSEGDYRKVSLEQAMDFFNQKPEIESLSTSPSDDEYRKRLKRFGL